MTTTKKALPFHDAVPLNKRSERQEPRIVYNFPSFLLVAFRTLSGLVHARLTAVPIACSGPTAEPSQKHVAAAAKIAKSQQPFSQGNRFISAHIWNPRESGAVVLSLFLTTINLNPKTLTIAIDSTLLRRFAAIKVGCGFQFDSVQKNSAADILGIMDGCRSWDALLFPIIWQTNLHDLILAGRSAPGGIL